jgi:hypothetical protein
MIIRRVTQLKNWIDGATGEFEDPSIPVCSLVFQWRTPLILAGGEDLVCGLADEQFVLSFDGDTVFPLPVKAGSPLIEQGRLITFGAETIAPGLWILSPSLNMPGTLHGYVTLFGVPSPAPWEQRIIIATEMPRMGGMR